MFATMDMNPTRYSFGLKYSPLQKFSLQVAMDQAIYGGGINLYFEDYQFHYNMGNHSLGMNHELGLSLYFGKKSEWMAAYINRLQDDADKFINKGEYRKAFKALERARRIEKLPAEYASPHERLQKLMGQRVFKVSESGKIAEMLRRGIGHYIDKKDEVAVEVFRMALRKDRRNKMAKRLLTLARGIEDAPKRVRAVSIPKFTEVDPVKLKLVKAEQHFQDELWDMALQELKQVIEINPKEVTAYVRMGSIYWVLGMKKEAKKAWQYAWRLNHRHPEVKRAVAFMKKEGLTK